MFALTPAAARQIHTTANDTGAQEMALRIAARVGADGSLEFGMGFDDPTDEDMKLDLDGVAVVIADDSQALLADTVLDYVELNPGEFNFIFMDATSTSTCSSGQAATASSGGGCGNGGCGGGGGGCGSSGRAH
jgi:iron-sulfur cluster assembly protein